MKLQTTDEWMKAAINRGYQEALKFVRVQLYEARMQRDRIEYDPRAGAEQVRQAKANVQAIEAVKADLEQGSFAFKLDEPQLDPDAMIREWIR